MGAEVTVNMLLDLDTHVNEFLEFVSGRGLLQGVQLHLQALR